VKVLVISSNFPNNVQTNHGLYIYELILHQQKINDMNVISPISITPPVSAMKNPIQFKQWLLLQKSIEHRSSIEGMNIYYPRILYFPRLINEFSQGIALFTRLLPLVLRIRQDFKFDIVHAHHIVPEGLTGVLLSKALGIPVVITCHGPDINYDFTKGFMKTKMIRYVAENANICFVVSTALKENLARLNIPLDEHIQVVVNGVDLSRFFPIDNIRARSRLGLPFDKQIVVYRGGFYPDKGINYLIDAFEIIAAKRKNILLFLIGEGELKSALNRKIKNLKLEDQIIIKTKIASAEVPIWMNAADLNVLPSLNEGFPTSIIESLACGIPVVATKVGGVPEIIPSKELGFLVNPRDCDDLAQKIILGLDKIWNKDELVTRAKSFSWYKIAGQIQQVYEKIALR